MKQITMDWETYERELKNARESGWESGIYAATSYIADEGYSMLSKETHFSLCWRLDEAIQGRIEAIKIKKEGGKENE